MIGKIFKTKKNSEIQIIKELDKDLYEVKCSCCSDDRELFPNPLIMTNKQLESGRFQCGCDNYYKWTKEQYLIRVRRVMYNKGLYVIDYVGEFNRRRSHITICCPTHSVIKTVPLESAISGRSGCPDCRKEFCSERWSKGDAHFVSIFRSTGVFHEDSRFYRDLNNKDIWYYYCPVCAEDDFSKNGYSTGFFKSSASVLRGGYIPCRCGPCHRWTEAERTYQLNTILKEGDYTFIKWKTSYENKNSLGIFNCKTHGMKEQTFSSVFYSGCRCPECPENHKQNMAYINLVYIDENPTCVKFGITASYEARLRGQRNKARSLKIETFGIWEFPNVDSCKKAEKFVINNYPCKVLSKSDMPDGYTETLPLSFIDDIITVYEDFGAIKIR